jgi:hypothetical protein
MKLKGEENEIPYQTREPTYSHIRCCNCFLLRGYLFKVYEYMKTNKIEEMLKEDIMNPVNIIRKSQEILTSWITGKVTLPEERNKQ